MQQPLITVIGGSGFVGRYIVRQLCQKGYRVRVICRNPSKAEHLKPSGNIGQIAIERADVTKPETLEGKLDGSHAVIYLPGLLYQSGRQRFKRVHVDGARRAAAEAATAGAERFIFVSALAVDNAKSNYAKTKIAGEDAVREAFPNATVLRPSLVIGAEDGFFQRFARMNMVAPALPLIAGGKTRFQPVYVEDVAQAAVNAIACPNATGKSYALHGPDTYSFRELLDLMGRITKQPVSFLPLPKPVAMTMGLACELLPIAPMITRDQVRSLSTDNTSDGSMPGLDALDVTPTHLEGILPRLLARYVKG